MNPARSLLTGVILLLMLLAIGCAQQPGKDYSLFLAHRPRSILVLPPLNQSTQVDAPYIYLTSITRPLAECGYYVFPVALIDAFMKENGLPTSDEMHSVPLDKIHNILGADAVLYVTIEDWGQKYVVFDSVTTVRTRVRLVDVATGTELWNGRQDVTQGTGSQQHVIAQLVLAVAKQIAGHLADRTREVAQLANNIMVFHREEGFLRGNYRPVSSNQDVNANDICSP